MKFEDILPAFLEGKKIKVVGSSKSYQRKEQLYCTMKVYDILYSDWEIVKETKKVKLRDLTEEQYEKWFKDNCCSKNEDKSMSDCFDCVFHNVICNSEISRCWILHKDLYSDKFLDQEIEIEE